MTTTVINLKKGPSGHSLIREYGPLLEHAPKNLVYVGRRMAPRKRGSWDLRAHPLHNPYSVKLIGSNEAAVSAYCRYLLQEPSLLARVPLLQGSTLACWCAPELCHAHVLAVLAERPRTEYQMWLEEFAADPGKVLPMGEGTTQKARIVYAEPPAARESEDPSVIRSKLEQDRAAVQEWIQRTRKK